MLLSPEALAAKGIELYAASRGGDVTYHGPGQLVGYPVFRLPRGVLAHVHGMADGLTETLRTFGVSATFRRDAPGLWVNGEKVCAFGVHVRRRVAIHGFALNVSTALNAFSAIVPCGLRDVGVTSIARLTGLSPSLETVASVVIPAFARAFDLDLRSADARFPLPKDLAAPIQ